jgi:hypothetical protein
MVRCSLVVGAIPGLMVVIVHNRHRFATNELGVLSSQCLDRRIPDHQTLIHEIAAWEEDRNANHAKADWQFTTPEARSDSSIPSI